jgi:hypothetical protein
MAVSSITVRHDFMFTIGLWHEEHKNDWKFIKPSPPMEAKEDLAAGAVMAQCASFGLRIFPPRPSNSPDFKAQPAGKSWRCRW